MTAKTRYLKTYRFTRSLNVIWWAMVVYCFFQAVGSFSNHDGGQNVFEFFMWVSVATGLIIAIKRGNKKRANFDR